MYQFALRHCITDTALISLVGTHVPKDAKSATLYKLENSSNHDLGSPLYTYRMPQAVRRP